MAQAVSESQWFAGHDGTLPAMSSPTNDYWLAAGLWRIGRLLMLLWVTFFLGTLWRSKKLSSPSDERGLLMHAILATLATSWLVHAAYNLGFIPVTATYPPLAGLSGSIAASQLFLVGYCLVTRGERPG
jgi:cell division protein FtsW (lipid II flippase)